MYRVDVLIQGFPGKAVCHGGLGWSTVTLIRGGGKVMLLDVGAFGIRKELAKQLRAHGVAPDDVTDVVLTHAHYDHAVNFTLFPSATVWIGAQELAWAADQPPGFDPLPELYVRELRRSPRVRTVVAGDEFLPGLRTFAAPGHTPGHLIFLLDSVPVPMLFSGDAAKNRAELLSREVDATGDAQASRASIDLIWRHWEAIPGTILVPGHDLSMVLGEDGRPRYLGERRAAITAWFNESLSDETAIDLCPEPHPALFTRLIDTGN
jgi:glyoxylase-like metal-dependent hydrolase (beta-lactamase superfamily II)